MGPLAGIRVLEVASIGPGPFCGMLLGDLGADVIRVDRPGADPMASVDPLRRNRRSIVIDLKTGPGVQALLRLAEKADALIEGFRPGVAERLGIGPDACRERNARLVYGRVTGWGQDGPLAGAAGHDLNFIALTGALHAFGSQGQPPVPPLNLLGDFGGGGMLLAFGVVCALLEARRSGRGQVVDAAMLDGVNALMAMFHGFRAAGLFDEQTGTHFLSGAAHFYATYETRDGKYIAIAALEPAFYQALVERAGLDPARFGPHGLAAYPAASPEWPRLKAELADVFRTRTRDEWCALLEGTDACFAPVLTVSEASRHPHNVARKTFITRDGVLQHAPVPRFDTTVPEEPRTPGPVGADTRAVLGEAGSTDQEVDNLLASGAVVSALMNTEVSIDGGDGHLLQMTSYGPAGAGTWLLINSAMGVRRRFYRHLAEHLSAQGIGVVTYDYRGMGDSVVTGAQAAPVRLEDWGRKDFPAVLRWLHEHHAPARVVVLGHSVGGQLLGIAPEVRDVDALVGVATQSGYWRHWDGVERLKVIAFWYVAIPLVTKFAESFPSSFLGLGQDIPSGVARQWADWGRDPDYVRSPTVGPQPQYFDDVRCRLRSYFIEGDDLATERASRAWYDWFPNAKRELVNLGARNPSGRKIGHFGFFDPDIGAGEWPSLADFVRG